MAPNAEPWSSEVGSDSAAAAVGKALGAAAGRKAATSEPPATRAKQLPPPDVLDPDLDIFSEPMLSDMPGPLDDFMWTKETHPHVARRLVALKAHPEIKSLYGPDIVTFYWVTCYVLLQFLAAYLVGDEHGSWRFWLMAYTVGATCNHALFLSIHEIGHNLVFKGILPNRFLSMFANLPVAVPFAISFRGYHSEHHRLQGVNGYDTDLPTWAEGVVFNNVFTKTLFCSTQILFYALRPMLVRYQKPTTMLIVNWLVQLAFDALVIYFFGMGPIFYFLASSFLAGSLHPCAGHFISEHYVFTGSHETFSYYGPLNWFSFNVGYHNEHHDFPNIPWTRLPALKAMAPELYSTLPYHTSWVMVTWNFITRNEMSVFNRVKREPTDKDLATAANVAFGDFKSKEE